MKWITLLCAGLTGAIASAAASEQPQPLALNRQLVAHWKFDEAIGAFCRDTSGKDCHAAAEHGVTALSRTAGVFGQALNFSGTHSLGCGERLKLGSQPKLAFSVWVLPAEFTEYNELFRKEDGDQRVLFAFQDQGRILSLGLNINGYIECDAKIDPARVLDGAWHHCAASFDGKFMRVYLDGREVGALERPGVVTAGGPAAAYLGSAHGGECFQGALDDLRVYADELTAGEVKQLCQNGAASMAALAQGLAADEPSLPLPLLAHWTFNEVGAAARIRDVSRTNGLEALANRPLPRVRGIHGPAAQLRGTHAVHIPRGFDARELTAITFAVWVKPLDLGGFREIFRQECPERLLFSFQENGTVLSLGLNVNGYEECDAALDPARVLDGAWHHCAATFDGKFMRVFLDGREIGALERPGKVALQPAAAMFIGSGGGTSEFFQGALDDLRVYAAALSPEQIALLHHGGAEAQQRQTLALENAVKAVYTPGKSFAETLAALRKKIADRGADLDAEIVPAIFAKLKASHPEEAENFQRSTGMSPLEYLLSAEADLNVRLAGRLMDLMLEYKPLTEWQRKKQQPEDLRRWAEADQIKARFDALAARRDATRFAAEWIDLMLEAGARIQLRPYQNEPVAPYMKPETPATRNRTTAEARQTLEQDWLHQADNKPAPERIRREIQWTRELAQRIAARQPGKVDFSAELAALQALEQRAAKLTAPDRALYFEVRELKRRVVFRNPVVDFDKMLMVDMPFPQGSEWRHETRHRLGYMAVPGGRLLVLDGLRPDGKLTQLMPEAPLHGSFWRPDVSFDAQKVVFCFKPHNEKAFHLYEINADGSGLKQLTDGQFDDLDPIYLPDDQHIIFSTTRGHTYVRCMPPTSAFVLARCDRKGGNMYFVSANNEPDYLPSMMNDGRVIYTRWEYTDKPLWRAQKLWTINPDGTAVLMFWGNQSVWPDLTKDARSIPGSRRVMFTGSAHHDWFSGSIGIIDPDKGLNFPNGLAKVTADVAWPECGNGPVDPVESPRYHASGRYPAYYSPYPLSEQDFLVSAERNGKFVLYLMDVDGNRELVYEGAHHIFHAQPLKPRAKPPVIGDRVAWPSLADRDEPKSGVIFSSNVYDGAPPELRGRAKFLRLFSIDHKTYTYWYKRPYISTGPVVSAVQSEGVKRLLGTVPIEADGSVAFHAPAGMAIHFQLLDERQRALHTMRSFVSVMPGEYRGCLGCHESHSRTTDAGGQSLALKRQPRDIQPPPWSDDTVSYPRYVQPVLNKYCGECHQGKGEARKVLDLTERPSSPVFTEPYLTLIGRPSWGQAYQAPEKPVPGFGLAGCLMVEAYSTVDPHAYKTPKPMTSLSYRSPLIELASSGKHHDVKVDDLSLLRLITWVDAICPYMGDDEIRQMPDPVFQGVDWLSVRPKIATAPHIARPGPVKP